MKAMIFAAGLGTRLRPLTNDKPKALIEIRGKTLLEITINKLIQNGFDKIIVNVHHFAEQIINFLADKKFKAKIEISDERKRLLDTGGGLKKAQNFFDDGQSFLVHNVDIITDLNLRDLYQTHQNNNSIATVAVRNRKSLRYLLFDEQKILCGWENVKTGDRIISRSKENLEQFAFSGIHVIDPKLFNYFPDEEKFSIIDVYLKAAKKEKIKAFLHNYSFWQDVGKVEDLARFK
jgi:NDP-sugar pyrophosphorylase family protein